VYEKIYSKKVDAKDVAWIEKKEIE